MPSKAHCLTNRQIDNWVKIPVAAVRDSRDFWQREWVKSVTCASTHSVIVPLLYRRRHTAVGIPASLQLLPYSRSAGTCG